MMRCFKVMAFANAQTRLKIARIRHNFITDGRSNQRSATAEFSVLSRSSDLSPVFCELTTPDAVEWAYCRRLMLGCRPDALSRAVRHALISLGAVKVA